ncbi:unannotated protein [freshwater metagenome]|uniref:Unannotated protein n=1 Tax=freshwater metagenome TaxID=449393 RepID=A0A6J6ZRQ3_9ZZZZ
MSGSGGGHHHHTRTAEVRAPAQINVVTVVFDARVESAESAEQIGTHQQTRRRHGEHIAHGVVLFLVDLARFDDRVDFTEAIDAKSYMLQHIAAIP